MPEYSLVPKSYSLHFVALLNPKFNPTYLLNFYFFIILACLLFIHANLLAGAQNVTGAYVIIMLAYRRLTGPVEPLRQP